MTRAILIAASAAALAVAGCQQGPKPVAGVCKPFPAANAQPNPADGAAVTEDCLHRWAYTLAGGGDDAGTVAEAVTAACTAPLSRWNQQTLGAAAASGAPVAAPSLVTGEDTNPIAEHMNFAKGRALFYVVQARAGACKPPPRKAGDTSPAA
jgi:hypothetical protein